MSNNPFVGATTATGAVVKDPRLVPKETVAKESAKETVTKESAKRMWYRVGVYYRHCCFHPKCLRFRVV